MKNVLWKACLLVLVVACIKGGVDLAQRVHYELQGPLTADSGIYVAVGRGILNGLRPYADLFETKPPGIFLLSAASLWLQGNAFFVSAFQALILALMPLLLVAGTWPLVRKNTVWRRRAELLAAFTVGLLLALYTAERSGEFQVESFGAFFTLLYVVLLANPKAQFGWLRTAAAALTLLLAIGLKEPFLLSAAACALFLYGSSLQELKQRFLVPLVIAAFAGTLAMALLGYLGPYISIYVPDMLFRHVAVGSSPFVRGWQWYRIFHDLQGYHVLLAWFAAVLSFGAIIHAFVQKTYNAAVVKLTATTLGLYLLALAVAMGGPFYNHHFVFAVPGYAALFVLCMREAAGTKAHHRAAQVFLVALTALSALALLHKPSTDYTPRVQAFHAAQGAAQTAAIQIDSILDSCHLSQYLFLGSNGMQPYAYTRHSPQGPLFFQYDFFFDAAHQDFRRAFVGTLQTAQFIVLRDKHVGDLRPVVDSYITQHFSTSPWECAKTAAPIPGLQLYYRHVPDNEARNTFQ